VGVAKSLFTLPFIPFPAYSCLAVAGRHKGRGSLIVDTPQLSAGWFLFYPHSQIPGTGCPQ